MNNRESDGAEHTARTYHNLEWAKLVAAAALGVSAGTLLHGMIGEAVTTGIAGVLLVASFYIGTKEPIPVSTND